MYITKALKASWVKALRSGQYKQGRNQLRTDDDCYCVWGVLCDLVNPKRWVASAPIGLIMGGEVARGYWYESESISGGSSRYSVPPEFMAGLDTNFRGDLLTMNDTLGMSFASLADFIENNLHPVE